MRGHLASFSFWTKRDNQTSPGNDISELSITISLSGFSRCLYYTSELVTGGGAEPYGSRSWLKKEKVLEDSLLEVAGTARRSTPAMSFGVPY